MIDEKRYLRNYAQLATRATAINSTPVESVIMAVVPKSPPWVQLGECVNRRELFAFSFDATEKTSRGRAVIAACKDVCTVCPVRVQCLAYALAAEDGSGATSRFGVWGGLSAQERAVIP